MSPEQAGSSKQIDHRSDIFSLGVILYQCVTHELPFKGDSLYQLLGDILHRTPPAVRSVVGSVPAGFEAIIERAMQKDPEQRYGQVAEMGAALLPFASPRVRLSFEAELAGVTPSQTGASARAREPLASTLSPATTAAAGLPSRRGMLALGLGLALAAGLITWSLVPRRPPDPEAGPAPVAEPVPAPAAMPAAAPVPEPKTAPEPAATPETAPEPVAELDDAGTAAADVATRPTHPREKRRRPKVLRSAAQPARITPAVSAPAPAASDAPPAATGDLFRDRK
jgi:serine/threonine-protein kinase